MNTRKLFTRIPAYHQQKDPNSRLNKKLVYLNNLSFYLNIKKIPLAQLKHIFASYATEHSKQLL